MSKDYDAIIIGSGQGGTPLAHAFADNGKKTLLIERDQVGGTCINQGCTPTKTLVSSAKTAHIVKRSSLFGVKSSYDGIDLKAALKRKNEIVESFRNSSQKRLEEKEGLDLVFGEAHFLDPHQIEVMQNGKKETFSSPLIVINAVARPMVLPIDGIENVP